MKIQTLTVMIAIVVMGMLSGAQAACWYDDENLTARLMTVDLMPSAITPLDNSELNVAMPFVAGAPTHAWNAKIDQEAVAAGIPIPNAIWLIGTGLIGLIGIRRNDHASMANQ